MKPGLLWNLTEVMETMHYVHIKWGGIIQTHLVSSCLWRYIFKARCEL